MKVIHKISERNFVNFLNFDFCILSFEFERRVAARSGLFIAISR